MSGFEGAVGAFAMPASARQAALLLHTMPAADRGWLLQQLPASQRTEAEQLLAELAELGVPADPRLLDEVLAPVTTGAPPLRLPSTEGDRLVQRLGQLPPRSIGAALQTESDVLVARVLRLAPWPWREAVLDHLGPTRRRRIQEHMLSAPVPVAWNALDLALLDVLCSHAERGSVNGSGHPVAPRAPHTWRERAREFWKVLR
ncbi:hypothetical protein [Rhizobacter sp. Root1221]|uniref:hypothetical protein n=1 Tax=Rhizobacter sp. Root1221 TaxID=1736433 RepID=UPI0006FC78D0|nr:hypothetical protein [Rhizobacter sp. Root1221]KQV92873.1 hypothetical protein ASC87_27345 [Rhizobacter sp. Root1221]